LNLCNPNFVKVTFYEFIKDNLLEIGVGSGFCSHYLRGKGINITTLDIDKEKSPDIVADVCKFELTSDYDHILAFEVFEHFPFENLKSVLNMLHKHCRKNLFVSLPINRKLYLCEIDIRIAKIGKCKLIIPLPKFIKCRKPTEYHHWEINLNKEYSLRNIISLFKQCNFFFDKNNFFKSFSGGHLFSVFNSILY